MSSPKPPQLSPEAQKLHDRIKAETKPSWSFQLACVFFMICIAAFAWAH